MNDFGAYLSSARQASGMTQRQLAHALHLSQSAISELESGNREPTFAFVEQAALILKVPIQWFLTGSERVGDQLPDLAVQLWNLGIVDLHVESERAPGAFGRTEESIAICVSGNAPSPRIIEALPAVLAWNQWSPDLLDAFASSIDSRVRNRLGWLADIALTIHGTQGFPGGCRSPHVLENFINLVASSESSMADSLGYLERNETLPPVSLRWKIKYPAPLETFRERAEHLQQLRRKKLTRAWSTP